MAKTVNQNMPEIDWRCYVITSGASRQVITNAALAAKAGAGLVQVRLKDASARQLQNFVIDVAHAVAEANPSTRLIVDDRCDIAFAARRAGHPVHGVHLGQDDLCVADARAILGGDAIIGLTTGNIELVEAADRQNEIIDYLGCGPFRPTPTKNSGRQPIGVDGYRRLVEATRLPLIAIGDVKTSDVPALAAQGVAGVAMVREVMDANDPGAVVRQVLAGFTQNN